MQEDRESPQSPGVLYDFVYLDRQRLAALAAQLFEQGLLTTTKIGKSRDSSDRTDLELNAAIAKGTHQGSLTVREHIERSFDASWSVPLDVIDQLRYNDMIAADIETATFGQLVLLEGSLSVYDIEVLKTMYRPFVELAAQAVRAPLDAQYAQLSADVDHLIATTTGHQKSEAKKNKTRLVALRKQFDEDQERQRRQADAIFDLVTLLPHALQATIEGPKASAWMTLVKERMITNPDDFALKHGSSIPGIWYVIGALDTRPTAPEAAAAPNLEELLQRAGDKHEGSETSSAGEPNETEPSEEQPPQDSSTPPTPENIVQGMKQMQDSIRAQFGRPDDFYGITPIAIYRQMISATEAASAH